MIDYLLPRTDGGVIVQVVLVTVGFAVATWLVRHRPEWRLLSLGMWLALYGAMGVRAIH